jgi:hypothetical protein
MLDGCRFDQRATQVGFQNRLRKTRMSLTAAFFANRPVHTNSRFSQKIWAKLKICCGGSLPWAEGTEKFEEIFRKSGSWFDRPREDNESS